MKYSIVIVTSSGEFRNLHLPGRDCGGGSSIQLKSFVLDFHRRLAGDFFWGGSGRDRPEPHGHSSKHPRDRVRFTSEETVWSGLVHCFLPGLDSSIQRSPRRREK